MIIIATKDDLVADIALLGNSYPIAATVANMIDQYVTITNLINVDKKIAIFPIKMSVDVYTSPEMDGSVEINIKNVSVFGSSLFGIARVAAAKFMIKTINGYSFMKAFKNKRGNITFNMPGMSFKSIVINNGIEIYAKGSGVS